MPAEVSAKVGDDGYLIITVVVPEELRKKLTGTDLMIIENLINGYLDKF